MSDNRAIDTVVLLGNDDAAVDLRTVLTESGRHVVTVEVPEADALAGADLVIEIGDGDLESTRQVLRRAADHVGPETPLATSTSVLAVTDVAAALPHPGRVLGVHLLTTGPGRGTVEIVRALGTQEAVVERLSALVDSLPDTTPVVVEDRPGFLLNALFLPYLNDVVQELDEGLATAEDIDVALQLGLGYKVGPFELLDRMGLDAHLRTTQAVHEATADRRYAPPPLLRRMVAAGHLGERSGGGFRAEPRFRR